MTIPHCAQDTSSCRSCICEFRCIRIPDSFFGSWRSAKFTNSRLFALVSPRLRRSSRRSWLRFRSFSTVLDSASALSARLANSGVLPRVGSSFSEGGPPVVQFSRNSRQLRGVSACVASEDVSSSESCGIRGAPGPRFLNWTAHGLLRWAERHSISLMPQFIMGRNTMLANFFSRLDPILGSGWTLNLSVFQKLRRRWPVSIALFATSLPHRCLPYFSPFHNPNALGTEFLLQLWVGWQAHAFPPYALIPAVL